MNEMQNPATASEDTLQSDKAVFTDLRDYSPFECIFAWLCIVIGYLFCRAFPPTEYPLGMFIVMVVGVGITFCVLIKKKAHIGAASIVSALMSVGFSFAFLFNTDLFPTFIAFACAAVAYCFFVYRSAGNALNKGDADFLPLALLRAMRGFSIFAIADMFRLMFARRNKSFKAVLKILLGFAAAVIPTAIVISLLSYDGGFSKLLGDAFSFITDFDFSEQIISILLGTVVAMYIFGIYAVNTSNRAPINCKSVREGAERVRVAPMLTVASALLPLAVVYVFFFVSQWQYYVSGFSGELPEGVLNYAEYARSGFFELCAVSAINLVIISAVALFTRRKGRGEMLFLRAVSVVFSLMTLVLIGTALAKMTLYIDRFGLTEKRLLSSWLMIVIAFVFLFIIIKSFARNFKLFAVSTVSVALMCGVLVVSDYSSVIANYNVERYISGETEEIDITALVNGDASAVPAITKLMKQLEKKGITEEYDFERIKKYKRLESELSSEKEKLDDLDGLFNFSFPNYRAKQAIEEFYANGNNADK